jgi:hypothetical protein
MKKKLLSFLGNLQASTLSMLESIGLLEKNSEMSTSDKLKMLLVRLIFSPLTLSLLLLVTIAGLIVTTVFFAVSLFRTRSLRAALLKMITQSIIRAYEYILIKTFRRKHIK